MRDEAFGTSDRRLDELRAALAIGGEQIARGEVVEWTPELAAVRS